MPRKSRQLVGVISDTHGLLRPSALAALAGCERILHGGDIGTPEVLSALQTIAPVTAVRGNNDRGVAFDTIADTEIVEIGGCLVYLIHDVKALDLDPAASGFAVVMSGHSHKPSSEQRGGVLYFNPGSAGPRRFKLPITVGRLYFDGGRVTGEIVELDP